jgi:signal transduction histidine kinase
MFSDNGLGIDLNKFKSKIFDPYQRFHLHTEGKGIGFHIVKSYIKALLGEIEVKIEPNAGTTFIIKFPFNQQ